MAASTPTHSVEPIAVVGMACRLPGARDVDQFWRNLIEGRESITFFTPDELRAAGVPEADVTNPDYVAAAPAIDDPDLFDADLFGMSTNEAEIADPQLRLFLELCHAALENAGYDAFHIEEGVGVFGTSGPPDYYYHHLLGYPGAPGLFAATFNFIDYFATRVNHKLALRGPGVSVHTACSSSLVAVHLASESLRSGECDMAIAGGAVVDLPLGHGHVWTPGGVYTPDGHCRPFDASGNGTIFGSGAGVVALKRLTDAIAAGDNIRAVIRASVVNNDGADKVSYSAPSVTGQTAAIVEAMALAATDPSEIGHVEAHATGTALGDPVEVAALTDAYTTLVAEPLPPASIAIGSVKSNIGHLSAAAGVASLIKTVLMLEHGAIVPTINVAAVNPRLELDKTPFEVATALRPWPRRPDRPRVAAVSSLGVGGTNAHLVLAEGPAPLEQPVTGEPRALIWSARDEGGVAELADRLGGYLDRCGEIGFADAAATLQHGRTHHPVRAGLVAATAAEAAAGLRGDRRRVATGQVADDAATTLLFPGQGSERPGMATGLYGTVRAFTVAMDECLELFEKDGVELYDTWTTGAVLPPDPTVVQPLLFAVEYSMAAMWTGLGAAPATVLGHSLGELVAATVAGVFDLPDAARIVGARAAAMAAHPCEGGMLAVAAPVDAMTELLADGASGEVVVAAINRPRQTVLSGPTEALEKLRTALLGRDIRSRMLPTAHAFHHPGWAAAVTRWRTAFADVRPRAPRLRLISARTGRSVTAEEATDPAFWTDQLLHPVRFWPAMERLLAEGEHTLLESGHGNTLTGLARTHPALARQGRAVAVTLSEDSVAGALTAATRLWVRGVPIDWAAAGQPSPMRRAALPGYPYRRRRYWVDRRARVAPPAPVVEAEPVGAVEHGPAAESSHSTAEAVPFSVLGWSPQERPAAPLPAGGTALVLLPASGDAAMAVLLATQRAGLRVVRVRPGTGYAERAGEFTVDIGRHDDLDRVLSTLAERGGYPDVLVHAAALDPMPEATSGTLPGQLDVAFSSLLALAQGALRHPPGRTPPRLVVITAGAVDVSGSDPVVPAKATALGLVRTLGGEAPGLTARVIDVGARVPAAEVAEELRVDRATPVVALRGRQRWLPVERPLTVPTADREVIREQGVYLITGGFGGLGTAVAFGLARTGLRPRLVLVGRHDPTAGAVDDPATGQARDAVAELRAQGAEVLTMGADVSDAAALAAVVDAVTTRYGPVAGLFHLAGVPGDRMVAFRKPADAVAVLRPKTFGTVALTEVFTTRPPLDFAVFFASRAGAEGLVGGADYAAANCFLDATAAVSPLADGRVLSIDWPVWQGAGMVDPDGPDLMRLSRTVAALAAGATVGTRHAAPLPPAAEIVWAGEVGAATHWVLDEHRVARKPLMPGTGYLDLVVTVVTERAGDPACVVELTDVVFRAPLYDQKRREVRLTLQPAPDGADAHDFAVASRPVADPVGEWTEHVTGRVATSTEAEQVDDRRVDVDAIRHRIEAAGPAGGSAGGGPRPFQLGPRWHNTAEAWRSTEEHLLRLELSPAFASDLTEHRLHPALLDTATAAIRTPEQTSFVPFVYRRLVLYRNLPGRLYGHARRRPADADTALGDVDLIAEDGTVLASVQGFTMRRTDFTDGWDRQAPPSGAATAPPGHQEPAPASGLDPDEGVRLLWRLLSARASGVVLVRPYEDGRPVPLGAVLEPTVAEPSVLPSAVSAPPATVGVTASPAIPASQADPDVRLRDLWAQILGTPPTGDDEDFFDAGGNSLAAVELMAQIRAVFGVRLSIGLLLERRTFGGLLAMLAESEG
ncbi:type I polyketide synthase [Plantactinospora mayteni]|uniref:type I polyketide synthase n=1 Tax=Plantactinospora mayteni TaxID=566021 RepID=UPI00194044F8|nr:type I polyketide synthase [Plantactinospora mayteni]